MNQRAAILAVPVLFGAGMIGAGLAWWIAVTHTAGTASGETITLLLTDDCGRVALDNRLADYGLPATWNGLELAVTLPGTPGDDAVPAALLAPGRLELADDAGPVEARLLNAGVQVSFSGAAASVFTFDQSLPEATRATLDGTALEVESVTANELVVAARGASSTEALRVATDRVVQVRWPLPCAVRGTVREGATAVPA